MNIKEYIESGILELYVYGALSEEESEEVTRTLKQYPEIESEVEEIEKALIKLSSATAPANPQFLINSIKSKLSNRVIKAQAVKSKSNWPAYIGWAASILLLAGLFFMFNKNNELRDSLQALQAEKAVMETRIADARGDADKMEELLKVLRDKDVIKIPLPGQDVAPDAYATAWWDKSNNSTYIDGQNLPTPPQGMVYQVWSLKMQPLTPSSIGLLDQFEEDDNKIFELKNSNLSEGFGITLEPAGGSETPTLERLYVLGVVAS